MSPLVSAQTPPDFNVGMITDAHILRPITKPENVVFLISGSDGWSQSDQAEAENLLARNIAVIGLDLPHYQVELAKHPDDETCAYAISDIEEISKRIQTGFDGEYHLPIIAGRNAGGSLAAAFATQVPASTIGAIVAVDPNAGVPTTTPLCSDLQPQTVGQQLVYGYIKDDMNVPVDIAFGPDAPADGVEHYKALEKTFQHVTTQTSPNGEAQTLSDMIDARLQRSNTQSEPLNLPITELPVGKPTLDTLAIIYSGDGGWRDIDMQVGQNLQKAGVPVVGVDSLQYFWNERSPQQTADDLAKMIKHYRKIWNVRKVLLIGYSFGADILPNSYDLLPESSREAVVQMTLMGLSHERDYVIHMSGWLGVSSGSENDPVKDLDRVPAGIVQCIYGDGDDDDACRSVMTKGYEMVELPGGHHFDGDYGTVTQKILDGLNTRSGANGSVTTAP